MTKILIVDDDPHIHDVICFALEKANMQTAYAENGTIALEKITSFQPDLVILDISMPEKDGIEVCRDLRKTSNLPVLFLSSRDDEIDRVIGLEIGGDDYVTKPFSPRELVARVKAILKRTTAQAPPQEQVEKTYAHGNLQLIPDEHSAKWGKHILSLTATEFAILAGLIKYPSRVYNRDTIMDLAYRDNIHVSDRTIDSHIRHIRAKFEQLGCTSSIETVHGVGYKLGSCQ